MKRHIILFLTIIIVIAVAYFLGVGAGGLFISSDNNASVQSAEKLRASILENNENLSIGQKLPNYYFYDIEGNFTELHKIEIASNCLVSFITSDCSPCIEQIKTISQLGQIAGNKHSFIMISFSNPYELVQLKRQYQFCGRQTPRLPQHQC